MRRVGGEVPGALLRVFGQRLTHGVELTKRRLEAIDERGLRDPSERDA